MTDQRLQEVLDQFEALSDNDFIKWVFEQSDAEEISKELLSLFPTGKAKASQPQR